MRRLALVLFVLLAACGRPSLDAPSLSSQELNLEEFFDGRTKAYGQVQDVLGNVRYRFSVDIKGEYRDGVLTLVEDFTYTDGFTEQRIWSLTKTGEDRWQGTADGVIGKAIGQEKGDTFNWKYTIDLPVREGGTMRVTFDDWMWLLSEDRLLNKAYMSRAGVKIAELIVVFEK